MTIVSWLFTAFGLVVLIFGFQSLFFIPLSLLYEVWKKQFLARIGLPGTPFTSIIIPAYNEEKTISRALESILASEYPAFEVIIVNDGSTDATEEKVQRFLHDQRIRYLRKSNGGKASALNYGIRAAKGDIILYTDADSFFLPDTIGKITRWFSDPAIAAVSGNDAPLHPETALQKLLTITTHIGSGFVRRALSVMGTLIVMSGNIGGVRKDVLRKVNGFSDLWGEDLDLTFKLHKEKAKIVFDPEAMVLCDVPKGFAMLWKQRVRWMRSFIKICSMHKTLFFNPRYAPFSFYLPVNYLNLVFIPLLLLAAIIFLPVVATMGVYRFDGAYQVLAHLGYAVFFVLAAYSILLDRNPRDLRFLPVYGWLIVPVSYFYNSVVIYSIWKEIARAKEEWHKIERRELEMIRPVIPSRKMAFVTAALVVVLASGFIFSKSFRKNDSDRLIVPVSPLSISSFTLATHFDAWSDPKDAVRSVLESETASYVTQVAVGSGRYEWNFFRWKGHEDTWSNDQKFSASDLLEDATEKIHSEGKKVVVIVDMYAPKFISSEPKFAAIDIDAAPSTEQVCFTELVAGEYGKMITEMVTYLAKNYDIDAISITELEYHRYCYDARCLQLFRQETQRNDWPRTFFRNSIDRNAQIVQEWRSQLLSQWLAQLADSTHVYGKKFYVDVPVHYAQLENQAKESGLYYPYVLGVADGIVVWDYFYLEGRSPKTSRKVASFLTARFDPEKVIISHGLWGTSKPVSPDELSKAVLYAIEGGAMNLWITPNHLLTREHATHLMKSLTISSSQNRKSL